MLSSHEGSRDGNHVQWYLEGHTYEIPLSLAAIFLKEGWAEEIDLPMAEAPTVELPAASQPKAEVLYAHKREYSNKPKRNR